MYFIYNTDYIYNGCYNLQFYIYYLPKTLLYFNMYYLKMTKYYGGNM